MSKQRFLSQYNLDKQEVLSDFRICCESRQVGEVGRKEVFMGKAKFGIFGGGKELAQVAMARFFEKGDWRSGYYRDQTFMFAIGEMTPQQLFAQLYAHPDIAHEPVSAGRLMTGHFGTRTLHDDGSWKNLTEIYNSSTDISPTASQMPRLLGLALASKLYRQNKDLHTMRQFSDHGNEVAFGTIGNASAAEGAFFETINAAGVLQVPMLVSVWDDGYGISVPNELQLTKGNISEILKGFQRTKDAPGFEIIRVCGWDYEALIKAYSKAVKICREEHVPVILHVEEMTQPGGHSTSGSHERYKPEEQLEWEKANDCLDKFQDWILAHNIATEQELDEIRKEALEAVKTARNKAWKAFQDSIRSDFSSADTLFKKIIQESSYKDEILKLTQELDKKRILLRSDVVRAMKYVIRMTREENIPSRRELVQWHESMRRTNRKRYSSSLYNNFSDSVLKVKEVPASYSDESPQIDGREILQAFFKETFSRDPKVVAFGEDVGKIGDVNQGFAGLQEIFGELRIADTGIRECTIIGQAIGAALRGLRPIAEIQYMDYILYALQVMSDDLATLHYRSFGGQKAPVIIRTRGHRLEGVWHSGSPMGTLLNSIRGIYICTPRNMTQAAGMYNSLLRSGDPGLVIECLNGYRLKEKLPDNIGEFTVPLGQPERLREGEDITIVTYGSMCRIVMDAAEQLADAGISCEVIDVQTLIPFDLDKQILESIKKTNRVLFADEDVPGGATAYMMQQVVSHHEAYYYLDSKPKTIHSWAHRPAYATDGDYFSKPNPEDVFDYVYEVMRETNPDKFPPIY